MRVALDWPTPDDLDLEVYKRVGDGLVEVASSGNAPGEKELADIADAEPGTYVLRVINYASASPTYTLKVDQFAATVKSTPGKRERYTLTCEVGGKVLQTKRVFVDRGQVKKVNLGSAVAACAVTSPSVGRCRTVLRPAVLRCMAPGHRQQACRSRPDSPGAAARRSSRRVVALASRDGVLGGRRVVAVPTDRLMVSECSGPGHARAGLLALACWRDRGARRRPGVAVATCGASARDRVVRRVRRRSLIDGSGRRDRRGATAMRTVDRAFDASGCCPTMRCRAGRRRAPTTAGCRSTVEGAWLASGRPRRRARGVAGGS